MKLLVTGGAGFIGHNFIRYVFQNYDNALVVCLDRIDEAGNMNNLLAFDGSRATAQRLGFVHHDLRASINDWVGEEILTGRGKFSSEPFDHVIHMAAGSHVDRSVRDPAGFIQDNVIGTVNLLEFFRSHPVRHGGKILYFSTDEVFGPAWYKDIAFLPWDRFNPSNPYSASKAAGEVMCGAFAATYGLPIIVTHCTNIFGERQHREKFIPLLIDRIRRGQLIKIHADETCRIPSSRYYTYVDNVSSAVLFLLKNGQCLDGSSVHGKYNISGDREISNLELAQTIAAALGKELRYELVSFSPDRPKHDMRYAVDARELPALGWKMEVPFEEGLRRVLKSEM